MDRTASLARRARVIELRRQGADYKEISRVVSCHFSTVGQIIRRYAPELGGYRVDPTSGRLIKGFAGMDLDRRTAIARTGGAGVPGAKRAFSVNRALATEAGRKGGEASRGGGRPRKAAAANAPAQSEAA